MGSKDRNVLFKQTLLLKYDYIGLKIMPQRAKNKGLSVKIHMNMLYQLIPTLNLQIQLTSENRTNPVFSS
jgi:hypothetical protein